MAYKNDLDYAALIKQAAESGDLATAAALEAARNEKIKGEQMDYSQTSDFSNFLGKEEYKPLGDTTDSNIDYAAMLQKLMAQGASASQVGSVLTSRVNKALGSPELNKYAYDDMYAAARQYIEKNKLNDGYDALIDSIINRKPFEYDPKTDPRFQAAATQYNNRGKLAMQDTMGEFASMTGGRPSSAAISAAQQTNNQYMSELSGQIPEFFQLAYDQDNNEFNKDLASIGALQSDQAQRGKPDETAYDMAWMQIQAGMVPEVELLEKAGISASYAKSMADYYAAAIAQGRVVGGSSGSGGSSGGGGSKYYGGGSGGSSGGGSGSKSPASDNVYQQMYGAGIRDYYDAYQWLKANGYNNGESETFAKGLQNKIDSGSLGGITAKPGNGGTSSGKDSASTIKSLYNKLSAIESKGVAVNKNVTNTVKSYVNSGMISEATARKILSNYGL